MYKKLTEKFFDDNLDNGKEAEMIEKENNPNEETGYSVIKIKTKEHKELFTIKGKFKKVVPKKLICHVLILSGVV
ncbi:hypothetical protein SAMN02745883_02360 [Caminicella sporogenes DSM 14501]|uniref:Uncharacterized protein n=1 Tax=Caminicella sporogenes DSM 14501 TaxID=1121266 RepID=A0A1M6TI84_9FIRM|nr:hypothetical protein [Caminicella sporogenes]RKD24854.1 hypothetical protein BET04_11685 [Caminicella sporogenes]SHK56657.1 hypothetical protein SAMN02745883_02360 [Caminicella sporogenes DSM 14501]